MKKLTQAQSDTLSYADVKIYIHEPSGLVGEDDTWRIEAVSDFAEEAGVPFEGGKISGLTFGEAIEIAKNSAPGKAEICFYRSHTREEG